MKKSSNSIKLGQIFKLGNHYLGCGDSRDSEFVSKIVGKLKIKAIVSDPPFGIGMVENKRTFNPVLKNKIILNDHQQSDAEYATFTADWLKAVLPYLEKKNTLYIFSSDRMVLALRDGMKKTRCKFGQFLIWVKTQAVLGRFDYAPQHELIIYGWYGVHEFLKSKDRSVIVHPRPGKSKFHPTTKPVGLIRRLILNSTRIDDVVFDGFLGSGTTLLACEETKRICLGIELDPEYVQTTIDRFEKLSGLKAICL